MTIEAEVVHDSEHEDGELPLPTVSMSVARSELPDLVNRALYSAEITYLSRHGLTVAAIVPMALVRWALRQAGNTSVTEWEESLVAPDGAAPPEQPQ